MLWFHCISTKKKRSPASRHEAPSSLQAQGVLLLVHPNLTPGSVPWRRCFSRPMGGRRALGLGSSLQPLTPLFHPPPHSLSQAALFPFDLLPKKQPHCEGKKSPSSEIIARPPGLGLGVECNSLLFLLSPLKALMPYNRIREPCTLPVPGSHTSLPADCLSEASAEPALTAAARVGGDGEEPERFRQRTNCFSVGAVFFPS